MPAEGSSAVPAVVLECLKPPPRRFGGPMSREWYQRGHLRPGGVVSRILRGLFSTILSTGFNATPHR
jgi:hypothetical protein